MGIYRVAKKIEHLDANINEYIREIHSAQKYVNIVSGRLNPFIYERKEILDEFKRQAIQGKNISLVFHKSSKDELERDNKKLLGIIDKYNNINLAIIPIIPRRQYLVTDNSALVQGDHKPGFSRELYVFRKDTKIVSGWKDAFEKLVRTSENIRVRKQEVLQSISGNV